MTLAVGDRTHLHNIWSRNIFPFSMENCVLYLPLWQEDMQGSPLLSYDQNHHSATVTGATWGYQGRTFDGIDDYIKAGTSSAFKPTTALSVGVWYKNDVSEASTRIISMTGADALQGWLFRAATNTAGFQIHNGTAWVSTTSAALTIGAWHCVFGVYDKVNISAYAEGLPSGTPTAETNNISYTGTAELYIAAREDLDLPEFFDGTIGEVWIYNRALTAAEIQNIYLATKWRYQ